MNGNACEEGNMDLKTLQDGPPWDWPDGAGAMFLGILRDNHAAESDRLLAAELAGDFSVINTDSEVLAAEEWERGKGDYVGNLINLMWHPPIFSGRGGVAVFVAFKRGRAGAHHRRPGRGTTPSRRNTWPTPSSTAASIARLGGSP